MVFSYKEKQKAIQEVENLAEKKRNFKVEAIKRSKTISQNAYIWLVFTHIGYETGNSKDDMYQYYLDKFPIWKTIYIGGNETMVKVTISGMDRVKLSKFIDQVVIDGRQEGYDIPDPKDLKCKRMMDYYRNKGLI